MFLKLDNWIICVWLIHVSVIYLILADMKADFLIYFNPLFLSCLCKHIMKYEGIFLCSLIKMIFFWRSVLGLSNHCISVSKILFRKHVNCNDSWEIKACKEHCTFIYSFNGVTQQYQERLQTNEKFKTIEINNFFSTVCGINCHKRCEKNMANLCGVNQKLLADALQQVRTSSGSGRLPKHPPLSSTSSSAVSNLTFWAFMIIWNHQQFNVNTHSVSLLRQSLQMFRCHATINWTWVHQCMTEVMDLIYVISVLRK